VTATEWAGLGVALATLISSFYFTLKYMVKSIMTELLPNSGNSMRDQISRIENRLDNLYLLLGGNGLKSKARRSDTPKATQDS
jgi:hypothetical protein